MNFQANNLGKGADFGGAERAQVIFWENVKKHDNTTCPFKKTHSGVFLVKNLNRASYRCVLALEDLGGAPPVRAQAGVHRA